MYNFKYKHYFKQKDFYKRWAKLPTAKKFVLHL